MTTAFLNLRRLFWGAAASGIAGLALAAPASAQGNPYCQYPYYNAYYCQYYSYYDPYGWSYDNYSYAAPYDYYSYAPYDYYAYDYGRSEPWIGVGGGWYGGHSPGHRWAHEGGRRWAGGRTWNGGHSRAAGPGGGDHTGDLYRFFHHGGGSGGAGAGGSGASFGSSSPGGDHSGDLRTFFGHGSDAGSAGPHAGGGGGGGHHR
jgi:hypothetical protein